MSKLRVYQIAKDFQVSSEALLEVLRGLNVEVKSHMSTVDDAIIEQVRQKFAREQEAVKAEEIRKQQASRTQGDRQARPVGREGAGGVIPAAPASSPTSRVEPSAGSQASGAPSPGDAGAGAPVRTARPGSAQGGPIAPVSGTAVHGAQHSAKVAPRVAAPGGAGAAADARRAPGAGTPTEGNAPGPRSGAGRAAGGGTAAAPGSGSGSSAHATPSATYGGAPTANYSAPQRPSGGAGSAPAAAQSGSLRRKDKKKKRSVDDRAVRDSVKKTLATMESGSRRPTRRRRVREDGSVIIEDEKLIRVNEFITLADLADHLECKPTELIAFCLKNGMMVTLNKRLDRTEIELLAGEFGFGVEIIEEYGEDLLDEEDVEVQENLLPRPPVVTIMGHVDHGKTSLLDYVRRTNVVAGEVGGITQHIGAYEVDLKERGKVTFLDTPGHEAFTAMRARGAQATDIVVLVIAADSHVMPQTLEAISHARDANVPIVVAINKIDLPAANVANIKNELSRAGLMVEEYGGKVVSAEISAKKGLGVDGLLDLLLIQAELLELTANPNKRAQGVVIESRVDKGRGIIGTVLVQSGTLRVGDPFLCGSQFGKVRAMTNERGQKVEMAPPSTPVEILGWSGTPQAGDTFVATATEVEARNIAQERAMLQREAQRRRGGRSSLIDFSANVGTGEMSELRIILKGDVAGSVEAISEKLLQMGNAEVKCRLVHTGVGQITESDVNLAMASDAVLIGFHVRPDPRAGELARREKVDIRLYEIIYDLTEDLKSALSGLLKPEEVEKVLGVAEVRQVFHVSKAGSVAGSMVTTGSIVRSARVRIRREGEIVWEGRISSLKRFKDDAREVQTGFECGISLEGHNDIREGDLIETFEIVEIARRVE